MSKVPVSSEPVSNGNNEGRLFALKTRLKKKKRRKDLEQLRRNVLAAKRNIKQQSLVTRCTISNKLPKNSLRKTLNMFAEVRHDNENKTQGLVDRKSGKKSKGKTICARLLPEPVIGIFKNGVKGKDVRRKAVKNFPLYGMNKAQLHADVFGLPNDEKNCSSSNEISPNNRNNSVNLDKNEKSKGKRDFYSIPLHNFQQFDMIKGNSTFNNANSPKWISNSMGMRNSGEMRQMMSPNVLGDVQRADKYKRRVLKSSYDDGDYGTTVLTRVEAQHFPQNPLRADDGLMQKELPTKTITDKMRSIKRWGISPAFCYDEFCEMIEEKLILCSAQADVPDPMMSIKATLAARYAEAREQQTNMNDNNEDSCTSCSQVDDKIPKSNQSSTGHKNQNDSWTNTGISSQNQETRMNFLQCPNMNLNNEINLMDLETIHDNTNEFLRKFEGEELMPREYMRHQGENSPNTNWIIQPSLSPDERPIIKKRKDFIRSNAKKKPTILQRSNSGPSIPVDISVDEFCGTDDSSNFRKTEKKLNKLEKFEDHLLVRDTNFRLPPSIMIKGKSNKNANNKMTEIYELSMPNNEFMKSRNSNSDDYLSRVNSSKCYVDKELATPLLEIDFDGICPRNYRDDIYPIDINAHGQFPRLNGTSAPRSKSMYCSGFVPKTNKNVPFWCTSNVNVDMKSNFIPINAEDTSRHRGKHYSATNVQLNRAVLHGFKDLSFEEDKLDRASSLNDESHYFIGNEEGSPRSCPNLYPPSKYYAVSNGADNDRVPRRVPVCISTQGPQSMSKMISEELLHRVNRLKQIRKYIPTPQLSNSESNSRMVSNRRATNQNNARAFPIIYNSDVSVNSCDAVNITNKNILTMTKPNVRFKKSFNSKTLSDACEILLDDGRIGLFVPTNYC